MKKIVEFTSYGVYGTTIHVVVETIVSFWDISFNGVSGTEIELISGKTIRVAESSYSVRKKLEEI